MGNPTITVKRSEQERYNSNNRDPNVGNDQFRFSEEELLTLLRHYLPTQAPLKDFVHHNTLHAFQNLHFHDALRDASRIFGYKTSLNIEEYRELYRKRKINEDILKSVIARRHGERDVQKWMDVLLKKHHDTSITRKTGQLHKHWRDKYHLDLNTIVHTNLFRILNSFLDQGIAITRFPVQKQDFLESLRYLDNNSMVSLFKTRRARNLFHNHDTEIKGLLALLVGDERYYHQYVFDQQFAHPGWSGLVSVIEQQPFSLLDGRKITLKELIFLELTLELDNLENALNGNWVPITNTYEDPPINLFEQNPASEVDEVNRLFQEAYEWSYYDEVLTGINIQVSKETPPDNDQEKAVTFQSFFCIDDRECSIRRHIEYFDPDCQTYGTPGHFGVDAYYQPKQAKFYTKVCPAPITPKYLIREVTTKRENRKDIHFTKYSHSLIYGWIISQTLGFWSAIKLFFNIFRPSFSQSSTSSFKHMEEFSALVVENRSPHHKKDGLQIGYTIDEMVDRVEAVLKSTGLVKGFAPVVYMVGHGASSVNNTHYAGYDCGACSGRPGSANARAFSYMANHPAVRRKLKDRGILIPDQTEFVGGLHDTTRDEITFYDVELLSPVNTDLHEENLSVFRKALRINAKERSRRFVSVNSKDRLVRLHQKVKTRAVSLFEPRPELNHATNSLCIIGRRKLNGKLFLDRRAFLNSYDYQIDPEGDHLLNIVNAAAPVCGGINLEYYFSRVDNEKLGAGSKLPHNVMGLIGVANGFEGDLRPGLPVQMVEVHDPIRLMMIIEHYPDVVLKTIQKNKATYEWFINQWVILSVVHPDTHEIYRFEDGAFLPYIPIKKSIPRVIELIKVFETSKENLPVIQLN